MGRRYPYLHNRYRSHVSACVYIRDSQSKQIAKSGRPTHPTAMTRMITRAGLLCWRCMRSMQSMRSMRSLRYVSMFLSPISCLDRDLSRNASQPDAWSRLLSVPLQLLALNSCCSMPALYPHSPWSSLSYLRRFPTISLVLPFQSSRVWCTLQDHGERFNRPTDLECSIDICV